jgi:hypothetical protein
MQQKTLSPRQFQKQKLVPEKTVRKNCVTCVSPEALSGLVAVFIVSVTWISANPVVTKLL